MARKAMSIKVDEMEIDLLKRLADQSGRTVTKVLFDGVRSEQRIMDLEAQIATLQAQYKQVTGKRPNTKHRVSISLTDAEFEDLRRMSYESKLPKSVILREAIGHSGYLQSMQEKPALEVLDSKV